VFAKTRHDAAHVRALTSAEPRSTPGILAMTTDPSTEARLVAAERSVRRLQASNTFLAIGFVLLLAWQLWPKSATIAAKEIELRDGAWKRRASLAPREDGSPALRLNNADGRARVMVNARDDGSTIVRLSDAAGVHRATLGLEPDGSPQLRLFGRDGRTRVTLEVAGDSPRLTLRDSTQKVVWSAP
jgi:hypothetical protein